MIVTDFTRRALQTRREDRDMVADGWEYLGERGGNLWEIYRGYRIGQKIVEAQIAADGMGIWVKIRKE